MIPVLFFVTVASAADGQALFSAKACTVCHHPTTDQTPMGLGPSLQMISSAYTSDGGKEALVRFLAAEPGAEPKVKPELYPIMKAQQALTRSFSDEERAAIADYILSNTP